MPTFLSEDWVAQAKAIRDEFKDVEIPVTHSIRANLVISGVPFGEGHVEAHFDTTQGTVDLGLGHIPGADFHVTMDYDTARAIIVEQDPQAGVQAFMAGRVKVKGDMTKLMALQQIGLPSVPSGDLQARLSTLTDPD